MTDQTKAALRPLADRLLDDAYTEAELTTAGAQWRDLAFEVFELVQPLDLLPCTKGAIAFVEFVDAAVEERLDVMSRTVAASRMEELSAQWRSIGW